MIFRRKRRDPASRILVVRNDKLGDFVLALPTYSLVKRALPEAETFALVPPYTREIAEMHPDIDRVLLDPGEEAGSDALADVLREHRFDAAIVLWATARVGWATRRAGIPWRSAPASKLPSLLYSPRVLQRRSQVTKPEYEYNRDLAKHYLRAHGLTADFRLERPVLGLARERVAERRDRLAQEHGFGPDDRLVLVHSGSGGSANNLSLEQYAQLIRGLDPQRELTFLLTAGPGEEERTRELAGLLEGVSRSVHVSTEGLTVFTEVIATSDLFIGGSTGPLHLAGALNRPTLAFYPRRRTSSPLRWQTLNEEDRRIAFVPEEPAHERDMSAIDVDAAAEEGRALLERLAAAKPAN